MKENYVNAEVQQLIDETISNYSAIDNMIETTQTILQTYIYNRMPKEPKNILLIRLDEIGDMISSSATIRTVREYFPEATITVMCSPHIKNMLIACPYIDNIISVSKKRFYDNSYINVYKMVWKINKKYLLKYNIDTVFVLRHNQDNIIEDTFAFLTGAIRRWGFAPNNDMWYLHSDPSQLYVSNVLLTRSIFVPPKALHEGDKQAYLMYRLNMPMKTDDWQLFFKENDLIKAKQWISYLPDDSVKIIIGIGGRDPNKHYPVERYCQACNKLLAKYNLSFIVIGADNEKEDSFVLENGLPKGKILNLCGKTTLMEAEAVISQADMYLGNDTGVLHMAAAAKLPIVGLYRDSKEQDKFPFTCTALTFAPYKVEAEVLRPNKPLGDCNDGKFCYMGCRVKDKPHCILQITVDDVVAAFERLYDRVNK